jgi:Family of unknown function (DUF6263)
MKYIYGLLLLCITVSNSIAQKVKPQLNLKKGNTYYMISSAGSAIVQTLNSEENTLNLVFTLKMAFKVIDIKDTIYNMEVSYQAIDMKIQTGGKSIEMNSLKPDSLDIPSSFMAAMMNQPFNIALTKKGKIQSVDNIEKIINGVFEKFPKIDQEKREQLKKQFLQSFGADAFKGSLEMGTAIFPSGAVNKDDKWTVHTSMEAPTKADVQTVYQLTDITPDLYLIHGDGTLATDKNAKPGEINGMPMKYDLNGSLLTDIKVDRNTGWISEVKLKQVMKGSIEIQANPQLPGGMIIPMTFNTDIITTDK